ncbi:MAG: helix-hairpin-helix domain-containing protein [Anaerovoracaceae bacterium]
MRNDKEKNKKINEFFSKYINIEFLLRNKSKLIKFLIVIVILISGLVYFNFKTTMSDDISWDQDKNNVTNTEEKEEKTIVESVVVDIGGAVNNPTVVELNQGARVEDAIEAAGGLTKNADVETVNRAAVLTDGEKILIPDKSNALKKKDKELTDSKVNINTANEKELDTLPGIGPSIAKKIIDYRDSNGAFAAIEEIKDVSGIGDKSFNEFKKDICV